MKVHPYSGVIDGGRKGAGEHDAPLLSWQLLGASLQKKSSFF